jgi:putative CocE/NonD family hydrolase
MTVVSRVGAAVLGLPRAQTHRVRVRRGLSIRSRDGVILRSDHYAPDLPDAPTLLVRTPYGRRGPTAVLARVVAEQGFHVLVQSCRGTFDSGGEFEPMRHERADGLDTIDWLRRQPWYSGAFGMYGPSYVGFTQWAVAADAGPELKALATSVTASSFRDATYAGGGFSLDTVLTWSTILAAQRQPLHASVVDLLRGQPKLRRGLAHPVLAEADAVTVGAAVPHYQEWLREDAEDAPYWRERGHDHRLPEVDVPVLMVGGWYDIFLPWQLADHAALRAAGRSPRLVIGPWHHGSLGLLRESMRESVRFLKAHLLSGAPAPEEPPVRVHVGGADEWRDLPDWPPAHDVHEWFLDPGGGLAPVRGSVTGGASRGFRYDPSDPTPAVGGPRLALQVAGPRDNGPLEARPDVLVYSSAVLDRPVEIVGPVQALIRTRSSVPYFDVFVRLCDVDAGGRSINLCDGLVRVAPGRFDPDADGVHEVPVNLWPAAHRFAPGHRIRVQVSGGAHPRWARNPGTGAALAATGPLVPADRDVLAGSVLRLPLVRTAR